MPNWASTALRASPPSRGARPANLLTLRVGFDIIKVLARLAECQVTLAGGVVVHGGAFE
ncbi:hypothetical protein D3C71_2030020 [compost metagenome]